LLAAALAGAGVMWLLRPVPPRLAVTRPSIDVRPAEELNSGGTFVFGRTPGGTRTSFTWTPDGQALVFVGRRGGAQQLYVRRLDATEARLLPNTDGAHLPAVSSDGRWVAFWATSAIRRVPLGGGPAMEVTSGVVRPPKGLSWSADGRIFFAGDDGRIWTVSTGAPPEAVTSLGQGEVAHALPWPLPDGRTFLYTVRRRNVSWGDEQVVAQAIGSAQRKVLLKDATDARYVPSGHLLFMRRGTLCAVAFDVDRLETRGAEVALVDGVAQGLTAGHWYDITGAGQFAVSASGLFAWIPSPVVVENDKRPVTLDRAGHIELLSAQPHQYSPALRLSPDGRRLVTVINSLTERGVWMFDLDRGTLTKVASGGEANCPSWSPDGRLLAFGWLAGGRRGLALQASDATGSPRFLVDGELFAAGFTPDGTRLVASRRSEDIVVVNVQDARPQVKPVLETPEVEQGADLSPDGKWLAYASLVSGRSEVYVRPFPGPGPAQQVSAHGGADPAWNPNGRELFFMAPDPADAPERDPIFVRTVETGGTPPVDRHVLMAVPVARGPVLGIGRQQALFAFDNGNVNFACTPTRCYDVARDGQRFYAMQTWRRQPARTVTHINLIPNWFEELKAKVPVGGAK
jgi:serine/threonine-protein kinase